MFTVNDDIICRYDRVNWIAVIVDVWRTIVVSVLIVFQWLHRVLLSFDILYLVHLTEHKPTTHTALYRWTHVGFVAAAAVNLREKGWSLKSIMHIFIVAELLSAEVEMKGKEKKKEKIALYSEVCSSVWMYSLLCAHTFHGIQED